MLMYRPVLFVALALLTATGPSFAQADREPSERPAARQPANPSKSDPSAAESLKKAAEKAVDKAGKAVERAGDAVKETLDLAKTGCLTQGDEADPFILVENESGERLTVVGSADLPRHVGHTVTVHGGKEAEGRIFHVTEIERIAASCEPSMEQSPAPAGYRSEPRANEREDRTAAQGVTADDQGRNAADRKTTQAIRKAITADETLSLYAHNVKIITQGGLVTLRGPVKTAEEKRAIEAKAAAVAGARNVTNELTVEPAGSGR
jgi:hypothetical protein